MKMVFAGGKAFLKRSPFANNKIFNGFYCEPSKDGRSLDCMRDFEDESMSIDYQKRFVTDMESCLPSDFKYTKVFVFQSWTNATTGQDIIYMKRELGDARIEFSISPEN